MAESAPNSEERRGHSPQGAFGNPALSKRKHVQLADSYAEQSTGTYFSTASTRKRPSVRAYVTPYQPFYASNPSTSVNLKTSTEGYANHTPTRYRPDNL